MRSRPARRRLPALPLLLAAALALPSWARGNDLLADLSEHLVAITTGFDGASILVFGALSEPADVVVAVRGPAEPTVMHRMGSVAGVWVNQATMTFPAAPAYYAVAGTGPLDEIVDPDERRRLQLGVADLSPQPSGRASPNLLREWQEGLIRAKERHGLYRSQPGTVRLLGGRLFRATLELPSNVPTGRYLVDVYLFRDGLNIAAQTSPLAVSKVGIEAFLSRLAHEQSALYGLASVLLALLTGWIAHLLFRRR